MSPAAGRQILYHAAAAKEAPEISILKHKLFVVVVVNSYIVVKVWLYHNLVSC